MVRPTKVEDRRPKTLSLDSVIYKEFEEIVGTGNISEEIRAFMRDRVDQKKKEEGKPESNPLNLKSAKNPIVKETKHNNIFEYFENKDIRNDICKYLDSKDDLKHLETLYRNCKTVVKVMETKRRRNHALGEVNRKAGVPSNEEILKDIKRAKRWMPLT